MALQHHREAGPERIMELATGFWASQALFTGLELGVFDALAAGPMSTEALACRLGLPSDSLQRLLGALGALGLLDHGGENWANAAATQRLLVRASPECMSGLLGHFSHDLYPLWRYLPDAVRENSPRWQQAFGAAITKDTFTRPAHLRSMLLAMDATLRAAGDEIVSCFSFGAYRHLLDVGGALGTLPIMVVQQHPTIVATVFELPPVQALAQEYIAGQGLSARIRTVAGDFFKDALPAGADLVTLSNVIREWDDRNSVGILRRCYDALEPGGTVLVLEKVLHDDRTGPVLPALMHLNMLTVTHGRERTAAEYAALLTAAGFAGVAVQRLTGSRDLICARKVS